MDKHASVINFNDYWVDKISFNKNYSLHRKYEGEIDFKLGVSYKPTEKSLLVSVAIKLFDQNFPGSEQPFFLEAIVTGEFVINKKVVQNTNVVNEVIEEALKANTVAILFPYVRNIISALTLLANEEPVILPTINTFSLIRDEETGAKNH